MSPDEQILKLLRGWGPEAIALLTAAGYFSLDREEIPSEAAWEELGPAFPRKVAAASLEKNRGVWQIVKDAITAVAFGVGVSAVAKQLNVPASAYDWNPRAQKFYDTHGDFFIKNMSQTDIDSLHQRIQHDFNLNPREFAKKYAGSYSCSPARLERIKRTETHMAAQGGGWQFANEANAKFKRWNCTFRGKWPRPSHRAQEGMTIDIDEPFPITGEHYPGQVNCRCWLSYYFESPHRRPE